MHVVVKAITKDEKESDFDLQDGVHKSAAQILEDVQKESGLNQKRKRDQQEKDQDKDQKKDQGKNTTKMIVKFEYLVTKVDEKKDEELKVDEHKDMSQDVVDKSKLIKKNDKPDNKDSSNIEAKLKNIKISDNGTAVANGHQDKRGKIKETPDSDIEMKQK